MKLKIILAILLPFMRTAAQQLRDKDENTTGLDDLAAGQIEAAVKSLEAYLS